MRYLIDTHTLLWFIEGSSQLSDLSKSLIEGEYESIIFDIEKNAIDILPMSFVHTIQQNKLPHIHKDPFDRLILSQAIININITYY